MSGRGNRGGRGRYSNRGGRGGSSSSKSNKGNRPGSGQRAYKFHPNGQSNTRFHPFDETLAYIVSKLRTKDEWSRVPLASLAIETMSDRSPQAPSTPQKTPVEKVEMGKKITVMEYDAVELRTWTDANAKYIKDKQYYDNMMQAGAAIIYDSYCTEAMQTKLRGLSDYTSAVQLDPLTMLERIRSLMVQGTTKEHPIVARLKWLQRALSPKQEDHERTDLYLKRVQGDTTQLFDLIGYEVVDKYTQESDQYRQLSTDTEKATAIDAGRHEFIAMNAYLGLQRGRYGDFQSTIEGAYALDGTDQFPKDLDKLRETLASDRFRPSKEWQEARKARDKKKSEGSKLPLIRPAPS